MAGIQYLLPCSKCGKKLTIEIRHAGQQLPCDCGAVLDVPTLREIRGLEQPAAAVPAAPKQANWNAGRGCVFAGGLVLIVIGMLVSGIGWIGQRSLPKPQPTPFDAVFAEEEASRWTPVETYDVYVAFRERGLGPYESPDHVKARIISGRLQIIINIGLTISGLGAAMSVATLLFRGRRS